MATAICIILTKRSHMITTEKLGKPVARQQHPFAARSGVPELLEPIEHTLDTAPIHVGLEVAGRWVDSICTWLNGQQDGAASIGWRGCRRYQSLCQSTSFAALRPTVPERLSSGVIGDFSICQDNDKRASRTVRTAWILVVRPPRLRRNRNSQTTLSMDDPA